MGGIESWGNGQVSMCVFKTRGVGGHLELEEPEDKVITSLVELVIV